MNKATEHSLDKVGESRGLKLQPGKEIAQSMRVNLSGRYGGADKSQAQGLNRTSGVEKPGPTTGIDKASPGADHGRTGPSGQGNRSAGPGRNFGSRRDGGFNSGGGDR